MFNGSSERCVSSKKAKMNKIQLETPDIKFYKRAHYFCNFYLKLFFNRLTIYVGQAGAVQPTEGIVYMLYTSI